MNKIIRRVTSGLTALAISMIPVNAPIPFVGTNVSVMTASAEETYGDYSYTINEDSDGEYVTITGYSGSDTTVVIPSKIKGLPVKVIGRYVFKNSKITSVKISEGIRTIGYESFRGCSLLETVILPDSLKTIGEEAFMSCTALKEIKVPNSVETINKEAFSGCHALKRIELGSGITEISENTFDCCKALTDVTIPDTVTKIGTEAFAGCGVKSIVVPDSVEEMGTGVFRQCSYLASIKLSNNLSFIPGGTFYACTSLKEITIPYYVESVGGSAFIYYKNEQKYPLDIEKINIGAKLSKLNNLPIDSDDLTEINVDEKNGFFSSEDGVLYNKDKSQLIKYPSAKADTEFTVPDTVEQISENAFANNTVLKTVYISENTKAIEPKAFYNCTHLDEVYFYNKDCEIYMSKDTINSSAVINGYKDSTAEEYANTYGFAFNEIQESETTTSASETTSTTTTTTTSTTSETTTTSIITTSTTTTISWYDPSNYNTAPGDVNCDGVVNVLDATLLNKYIANNDNYAITVRGKSNADVYKPGSGINLEDSISIYYSIVHLVTLPTDTMPFAWGDVNQDGVVDQKDIDALNYYIERDIDRQLDVTPVSFMLGDVYKPGHGLTEEDVRALELAVNYNIILPIDEFPDDISLTTTTSTTTSTSTITTTSATTSETTTVTTSQQPTTSLSKGDVTGDSIIDGRDASSILTYYAQMSTEQIGSFNEYQIQAADVNGDDIIDARDASLVLTFYAYTSTGHSMTLDEYISEMNNPTTSATTTTVTTTTTSTTTETTTTTTTANTAWKQLYLNAATSYESSNSGSVYKLIDLNGDGIPELYARNSNQGGALWTVVNDKIMQLKKWDNARTGSITNYSETNHTFVTLSTLSDLYYEYAIWSLSDNGDMLKKKAFTCNNGKFAIDYVSTTQDQYNSVMNAEVVSQTSVYSTSNDLSISKLRSRLG